MGSFVSIHMVVPVSRPAVSKSWEAAGIVARRSSLLPGSDATEPPASERFHVGRGPVGPAAAPEDRPGESPFPDPSPDGLIVGPQFLREPGRVPQLLGQRGEAERPACRVV